MAEPRQRPSIAIGHVMLEVSDVARSAAFYNALGLRPVFEGPEMAILELRGGTHMMLFKAAKTPKSGAVKSFDFMVDDVRSVHAELATRGVTTSAMREHERSGHSMFDVTDPDGYVITLYSDHTEGRPV